MMELESCFKISATMVANEFIDRYMAAANGEYVKVYLYLLRHNEDRVDTGNIADALNHTEADVKRALTYWEKLGILKVGRESAASAAETLPQQINNPPAKPESESITELKPQAAIVPLAGMKRSSYGQAEVNKLAGDEEFAQLLYIVQKYLNKVFTQRECEVFAYLYDGIKMSTEVLEYLVEHCVQGGHNSIRYIETVALNWHEKGLDTVEKAKAYSTGYMKDSFAVMKAFGIADRHPGEMEKEMINRWFTVYGFTKELVIEACNRTINAIHNPSFRYADKILSEWKKAGVKHLSDLAALDGKRSRQQGQQTAKKQSQAGNRFHNFEQRDTDYDSMMHQDVKDWIKEQ